MAPLMTAVSKPNNNPPSAATAAGKYRYRADPSFARADSCTLVGFIWFFACPGRSDGSNFLNCQQSLLQENESRSAGNSSVSACALKNDWNLSPKQNVGAARDLFVQRGKQLRSGCRYVPAEDEQFGIEHVQEAYQRGSERFESDIQHATGARVALGGRLKDSFRARNPAGIIDCQAGWRSAMDVRSISRLDGARRKTSFHTSVIAANAKPAADVEGDVSQMAGGSGSAAHDYAVDQRRSSNASAQREQNDVAASPSLAPKHFADQSRACVVVGIKWQTIDADQFPQQTTFQKIQVARQAVHARSGGIDDSLAANSDSEYWACGSLAHGLNKITHG